MKRGRVHGLVLVLPTTMRDGPIGYAFYIDDPDGRLFWRPATSETHERLWDVLGTFFFDEDDRMDAA